MIQYRADNHSSRQSNAQREAGTSSCWIPARRESSHSPTHRHLTQITLAGPLTSRSTAHSRMFIEPLDFKIVPSGSHSGRSVNRIPHILSDGFYNRSGRLVLNILSVCCHSRSACEVEQRARQVGFVSAMIAVRLHEALRFGSRTGLNSWCHRWDPRRSRMVPSQWDRWLSGRRRRQPLQMLCIGALANEGVRVLRTSCADSGSEVRFSIARAQESRVISAETQKFRGSLRRR